jgi:SAM-dependent methyltransferase
MIDDEEYYQVKAQWAARTYFGGFPKPYGKILEYGCGIGQNIACLEDAIGYDVSPDALRECQRRGIATISSPRDIPRHHFDYVLCRHVLEHVEHPLSVLKDLVSFSKNDGVLILVLPKEQHARVPLEADIHRHLYCWNFRSANNLIRLAGAVPTWNACQPMFGRRIHTVLRPVLRTLGQAAYFRLARIAGHVLADKELVIHARPYGDVIGD